MKRRSVVIGGGVIGLSIALELARRGDRVSLFERDQIGRATSWSASGILPPANFDTATDPIDQLRGLSHRLFGSWVDDLQNPTGIDVGLRRCGGWYLANSAGERAAMTGMANYWKELKIQCVSKSLEALTTEEPCLADWARDNTSGAAWWVPDEAQVRPPRLLRALAKACEMNGVELHANCNVEGLTATNGICSPSIQGQLISADAVVVCGGAWSGEVASSFGLKSSLIPVRGQILLLKTERPLLRSIVNCGNRYILCRDDGHTIIGSCEEEVGFQVGTTESMMDSLYQFATTTIPALASSRRTGEWSGLRPMTFDGFPIIGRVPETDNLFVAAGHFRSGLHLAPATALCMADLIEGQRPPLDLDPFRVANQLHQPTGE